MPVMSREGRDGGDRHRPRGGAGGGRPRGGRPAPRTPPPEVTGDEARYLWTLRADETPIKVTLSNGEVVIGTITYFDHDMVKIEAMTGPSLVVRKTDIRSFAEVGD